MFNLEPTEAQQSLDKDLRALSPELRAHGLAAEREHTIPVDLRAELEAVGERLRGTQEAGSITALIALEALAFGDPGITYALVPSLQAAQVVRAAGSVEQQDALIPLLARNQSVRASYLYYEGYGRGSTELATTATRQGDRWTLAGTKVAVHHPGTADVSVVVARDAAGGDLVAFAFEGGLPGLAAGRDTWQTGALGASVTPTGTVVLDGLVLTEAQRLPGGAVDLHRAVALARLLPGAVQVGGAQAAVDYAIGWTRTRIAWGKALSAYQGVSFKLVEIDIQVDSARLDLWDAAQTMSASSDPARLDQLAGLAVRKANNVGCDVTREGIQLLGVHGIVVENPQERFWRHAMSMSLVDFDPLATSLSLV